MLPIFSKMHKLVGDALALFHSPSKINNLLHIPLYANAIYLMLAYTLNALLGFVFWIIAARLYSPSAVGVSSAVISAAGLISMLSSLGLDWGLIRFLKSSDNPIKLINSSFTLAGVLSVAAAGIFIMGLGFWSPGLIIIRENHLCLVIFLLFVPVLVFDDFSNQVIVARRKTGFILIRSLIFNILRLTLVLLLASFSQTLGMFVSWSTSLFIGSLVVVFLLLPRVQPGYRLFFGIDKKEMSKSIHFSFLNYLCDNLWSMPGLILPIIVVNLLGAKNNAYFYMAWTLSSVLTLIPMAVATSLLAEGAYDETKLKNNILRALKMVTLFLIPAAILVWFLANKLLLLYGGLYADNALTLLRWLTIAAFPLAINIIYFSIKRVQKNVKPIILLAAVMTVITLLLSYFLISRLGINGVGIAWLAGQSAVSLIIIISNVRRWILERNKNNQMSV